MPLATKNNALIVKDGKVAENCGCCVCSVGSPTFSKVRIRFSNLPQNCLRSSTLYPQYAIREWSDFNDCAFNAFRDTTKSCAYKAVLPGTHNTSLFGCDAFHPQIVLDLDADTLSILYVGSPTVFVPEQGKTFRGIPYSGGVTLQNVGGPACDPQSWGAVFVDIDADQPTYNPSVCPNDTRCVAGVDTIQPPKGTLPSDVVTCQPCDVNAIKYISSSASDPYAYPGIDELNVAVEIGELNVSEFIDTKFTPARPFPASIRGFKSMSGTYALKYTSQARFMPEFISWYNSDFTIAPPAKSPFVPSLAGCGWAGLFYSVPYGQPAVGYGPGKGYEIKDQTVDVNTQQLIDRHHAAAMQIAVVPVGWHMPYDNNAKSFASIPCTTSKVAYQIRVAFYQTLLPDSGYGYYKAVSYWNREIGYYDSVECQQKLCGQSPDFSLTKTVPCVPSVLAYGSRYVWTAKSTCDLSIKTV